MRRQSEAERARRARKRELFAARLCLNDCGRPMSKRENLCEQCSAALVEQYFARLGAAANRAQTAPERAGVNQPPLQPHGRAGAALAHESGAVSQPAPGPNHAQSWWQPSHPHRVLAYVNERDGRPRQGAGPLHRDARYRGHLPPDRRGGDERRPEVRHGPSKESPGAGMNMPRRPWKATQGRRSTPARSRTPQPAATGRIDTNKTLLPRTSGRPWCLRSAQPGSCAPRSDTKPRPGMISN